MIFVVSGILCLLYGLSLYFMHTGSRFYLFFILLGAAFPGLFLFLSSGSWARLPAGLRRILLLLCAAILLSFLGTEACIFWKAHTKAPDNLDAIIVLGAQVWPDGPSRALRYRLEAARSYLEENEGTVCVVSGGQGANEPCPEAEAMAAYLIERGIPSQRIFLEADSTNTRENLFYSSRFLSPGEDHIGIVTNDFHILRALLLAGRLGYGHVWGIPARSSLFSLPANAIREYFALIKALLP